MATETASLRAGAETLAPRLREIRRAIHRRPEYGFAEHETGRLVASALEECGARVRIGIARTAIVAELGSGSPIVGIRADMDALPIQEATRHDFRSEVPGMMHACGHDAHVACALGAAWLLARRSLPGTVRLLFQPSEEQKDATGKSGGMLLVEEGALEGLSSVIALHTRGLRVGQIGVTSGPALAANDTFKIVVEGRASHAAHPEDGVDAIVAVSQLVSALQQVVSRRTAASRPSVVSVTTIAGGTKENVLCDRVELGGTIRSVGGAARERLLANVRQTLGVVEPLGACARLDLVEGYPVTSNDPVVTAIVRAAAVDLLGPNAVVDLPFDTWAEDFGYMTAVVPGSMFFLGVASERVPRPVWHSPTFDLDEAALPIGAAVLAASAIRLLEHARE